MRNINILRGLSSRFLSCGCLIGVYETYDGHVVCILDAKDASCADSAHDDGKTIPLDTLSIAPPSSRQHTTAHSSR